MVLRTKPVLTAACRPCVTCPLIPYPPAPPPSTLLQPHWPAWCSQTLQVLWSCSLVTLLRPLPLPDPQVSALSSVFTERSLSTPCIKEQPSPHQDSMLPLLGLITIYHVYSICCPLMLHCKLHEGRDLASINYVVPVYLTLFLAHSRA